MSKNKKFQKALKKERGITLIALVITIVILIILATIAIRGAFGDNGLVGWAKEARDRTKQGEIDEDKKMSDLDKYIEEQTKEPEGPKIPTTVKEAKETQYVFTTKTPIKDEHDNVIKIPEGFKVPLDSGNTVQQGIVIEDVNASNDANVQGSQYVWIPVGTFKKDDGSTSGEIKLGRYTFDGATGEPTLEQDAANYTQSVVINSYFAELSTYREGVASSEIGVGLNTTAKDLKGFIDSVDSNGGYYIGRYEASYASGSSTENYKAASKISNGYNVHYSEDMSYNPGTLWNLISQQDASKVAINTYEGSTSVKSDLINSYAWDTAIVYIQEAENSNYANQECKNTSLSNTGENGDEVCKINDMASNIEEWTTEYSSQTDGIDARPCTSRGGYFSSFNYYTAYRHYGFASISYSTGFRLSLYL